MVGSGSSGGLKSFVVAEPNVVGFYGEFRCGLAIVPIPKWTDRCGYVAIIVPIWTDDDVAFVAILI